MILIGAHQISKSFATKPLFKKLTFSIESGERIGLIGPNGAGKSTLLKILAGQSDIDDGQLSYQKGLRIGFLEQVPKFKSGASIYETVSESVSDIHEWTEIAKVEEAIAKLDLSQFPNDMKVSELSGGWKKRVALARELVKSPDLMLLDEPTNHLDVEGIIWLEEFLARGSFASLTITHDRLFLQRVANRIIELDRRHPGGLLSVVGDYTSFLESREQLMAAQEQMEIKLKNTLRRETEWLRRGAKARTTKQTARITQAGHLAQEVSDLESRNKVQTVRMDFKSTEKSPKKLVEAKGISKSYTGQLIIPTLDLVLSPKSRIGLAGPNGVGKSTLIKLLTKQIEPDTGTVMHADKLQVSYFEQNRESLNPEDTVQKAILPLGDHVAYGGQMVHIKSYLSRFLFTFEQMDAKVEKLSGGEQSRLLLARIMLKEANLLVLDEPTNDLDMSTLDILAEVLAEFNGAIILVTHDRYFLDQISNQILAFGINETGEKVIDRMVGFEQWQDWHNQQEIYRNQLKSKSKSPSPQASPDKAQPKRKLSYKETRELETMEADILTAEAAVERITAALQDPAHQSSSTKLQELTTELQAAQSRVDKLYTRWSELTGGN